MIEKKTKASLAYSYSELEEKKLKTFGRIHTWNIKNIPINGNSIFFLISFY